MPRVDFVFRLAPEAIFGLAQDDWLVLPPSEPAITPDVDSVTNAIIAPGSQSVLRSMTDRLNVNTTFEGALVGLLDNYLTLSLTAESGPAAVEPAITLLNRLLPLMSFEFGRLVTANFVQATDELGTRVPFPVTMKLMNVQHYDLQSIRAGVGRLSSDLLAVTSDLQLAQAFRYFASGLALVELRHSPAIAPGTLTMRDPVSTVAAEAFLNFWKVLERLLGASTKSPAFRRRCRELGFDEDAVQVRIARLYAMRDDADVAHMLRSGSGVSWDDVGIAQQVARDVLKAFLSLRRARDA